jgi:hypothetical protein
MKVTRCRRTMEDGVSAPEGQLLGHTEGITHVSARGDGIHLISNSKDSTVRLWDLRKMTPGSQSVPRSETVRPPSAADPLLQGPRSSGTVHWNVASAEAFRRAHLPWRLCSLFMTSYPMSWFVPCCKGMQSHACERCDIRWLLAEVPELLRLSMAVLPTSRPCHVSSYRQLCDGYAWPQGAANSHTRVLEPGALHHGPLHLHWQRRRLSVHIRYHHRTRAA